jgi:transcriptional regulator with XRE-family HTH domain
VREQRKLTQDRLAELTGISKGFISDAENDKRNISSHNLLKIADVLHASLEFILRGSPDDRAPQAPEPIIIPPELSAAAEDTTSVCRRVRRLRSAPSLAK